MSRIHTFSIALFPSERAQWACSHTLPTIFCHFYLCLPFSVTFISAYHFLSLLSLPTIFCHFYLCLPFSVTFISAYHFQSLLPLPIIFSHFYLCLPFSVTLTVKLLKLKVVNLSEFLFCLSSGFVWQSDTWIRSCMLQYYYWRCHVEQTLLYHKPSAVSTCRHRVFHAESGLTCTQCTSWSRTICLLQATLHYACYKPHYTMLATSHTTLCLLQATLHYACYKQIKRNIVASCVSLAEVRMDCWQVIRAVCCSWWCWGKHSVCVSHSVAAVLNTLTACKPFNV